MKEIFLVPYAHLDTQWRWEYPTTIGKYIRNTMEKNLRLFKKYPGYRFNFTGARRYGMMKEYYPELFEEVKRLIAEKRWNPAGTCLDETDALIPSSESLIRNILYGDRWQMTELGRSSRDYMIPDCFGFPSNMPTLMAHCAVSGFSSQKLTWGSAVGIPFDLGIWKGPDGSGIVSALNPCAYVSKIVLPVQKSPARMERLNRLGEKNGIWKSFQYYGVGDIGGAPGGRSVRMALKSIGKSVGKDRDITVRQGSPDDFFFRITEEEKGRMDSYEGDFLLTNHSAGSITSAAIMKRWNRKNEQLAFAAEEAAVVAMLADGAPYPEQKISAAWPLVIGSQMHDILPGTSTPEAYEYSWNDEVIALKTWTNIIEDSARAIAPHVPGEGSILLYNPLGTSRSATVDLLLPPENLPGPGLVSMKNGRGEIYPAYLHDGRDTRFLTFCPTLPPSSWTRFELVPPENGEPVPVEDPVVFKHTGSGYELENRRYRLRLSPKGALVSVFAREPGKELLAKPLAWEFQRELPRMFPAWNMEWDDREKPPFLRIEEGDEVMVLENNPLRVKLHVLKKLRSSTLIREISLSSGGETVEILERIDWREQGCSLKAAFHTTMDNPDFTCNWETSRIKREVNNSKVFEMPSRLWADLSEGSSGLSVLEDSKYGWDHPEPSVLRLTLLFTPAVRWNNGFRDQKYQDWGDHTIRYALYAHNGDWRKTDVHGRAFNQPVHSFLVSREDRMKKGEFSSLFSLSSEQFALMAVKKREDDHAVVIRLCERHGRKGEGRIDFSLSVLSVEELNGLEETLGPVDFDGRGFSFEIEGSAVKTFSVHLEALPATQPDLQKYPDLPFNCRLVGYNHEKSEALLPGEIVPSAVEAGDITFPLAAGSEMNALLCDGQTIAVEEGFNTFSLLASAAADCHGIFQWLDSSGSVLSEERHHIPGIRDSVGQWDRRIWKKEPKHQQRMGRDYFWFNKCIGVEKGYIHRKRLEWFSTHTHSEGEDQYYRYGHLYNLSLPVPRGAATLRLPGGDDRIFVHSAVQHRRNLELKNIRLLTDKYDF